MLMKTTLEIPDELFRQTKTRAATENRRFRDLVTEGLTLLMEKENKTLSTSPISSEPPLEILKALDEIRQSPLITKERLNLLIVESQKQRKEGWDREDRKL